MKQNSGKLHYPTFVQPASDLQQTVIPCFLLKELNQAVSNSLLTFKPVWPFVQPLIRILIS